MIQNILNKIEEKRYSKSYFWVILINFKDFLWRSLCWFNTSFLVNNLFLRKQYDFLFLDSIKRSKGILHVGAHLGEEAKLYNSFNKEVFWIEANPDIYSDLKKNISEYKNQKAINALVTDKENKIYSFNISNNFFGVSSSIFDFGEFHKGKKSLWKGDFFMVKKMKLKSKTLKTIYAENKFFTHNLDLLVLDIQGAELLALKGMGKLLDNFKFVWVEVSQVPIYKKGVLLPELTSFLNRNGFHLVSKTIPLSGDVLFVKK